jgi:hypothetical protein
MTRRRGLALRCAAVVGALAAASCADPAEAPLRRLYAMRTETGMPHLAENLRYAVINEERCLDTGDLSDAFWMLKDVSLQDCRLRRTQATADRATCRLECSGGHGTTGTARWVFEPQSIAGTLDVRLGGKNMTFYQRITARALGSCR